MFILKIHKALVIFLILGSHVVLSGNASAAPCATGGDVTISANCEIDGIANYNNLTISSGAVVTSSVGQKMEIIASGTVTIDALSGINVSGKGDNVSGRGGSGTSSGTGCGGQYAGGGGGGGYGGVGSNGNNDCCGYNGAAGGSTYGSSVSPTDLGSVGGLGGGNAAGFGMGGGAVKISADNLALNGFIRANGTNGSDPGGQDGTAGGGGGSGGSIWLSVQNNLNSSGLLQAIGGNGGSDVNCGGGDAGGGGGGGGRIAVYYKSLTGAITHSESIGSSGSGGVVGAAGSVGTYEEHTLPVCDSFFASPAVINLGLTSTLTWSTTDATSVDINGTAYSVDGSTVVSPTSDTTYILTASNSGGAITCPPVTITVNAVCNDGLVTGTEVCDTSGDIGCASPSPKCDACSSCIGVSGDGLIGNGEICDTLGNVGCASPNPVCIGGTSCGPICGDGAIGIGEACDTLGNVGCGGLDPYCKKCQICGSCISDSQLKIMDKSVYCIVKDATLEVLKFAGSIALFVLIISGIYLAISGGSQDIRSKAKKFLIAAIVGLVLVLISYAILAVLDKIFAQI